MIDFNTNKILITGTNSGLGKQLSFLISESNDIKSNNDFEFIKSQSFDIVLHCAASNSYKFTDIYKLFKNNILLTYKLIKLKPEIFVFFSTVDIYSNKTGLFSISKYISEFLIKLLQKKYVIYRCSAMLGKYMRLNHTNDILSDKISHTSLNGKSIFRYITHKQIYEQISKDITNNNFGTFTLTSQNPKLLSYFSIKYSPNQFSHGKYRYETIISEKYPIIYLGDSEQNFISYMNEKNNI